MTNELLNKIKQNELANKGYALDVTESARLLDFVQTLKDRLCGRNLQVKALKRALKKANLYIKVKNTGMPSYPQFGDFEKRDR